MVDFKNTGGRFSGNAGNYDTMDNDMQNTGSNKGVKIGMAIIVGICVCVISILIFMVVMFNRVLNSMVDFGANIEPEPGFSYDYNQDGIISDWEEWYQQYENGEFDGEYSYDEDYASDEYVPDPSDDYLEAIVSSTVRGLSYEIAWNDTYLYADDENNEAVFYCYYPFVIGSDADYVADINAAISQTAMSFVPDTLETDAYGYLDGYVTYVSEDMLSVVLLYYYDHAGNEDYHISTLNFDMKTGKQMSVQEMLPKYDFIMEFRADCEEQNGRYSSAVLESMTDDEILKAIIDPETGAIFYSPVGLDIGFNYPDGWMTVTLKFETY